MGGVEEVQEGENIYILMTDSHCCMAEANTKLQNNYPPIINKLKNKVKIFIYFQTHIYIEIKTQSFLFSIYYYFANSANMQ